MSARVPRPLNDALLNKYHCWLEKNHYPGIISSLLPKKSRVTHRPNTTPSRTPKRQPQQHHKQKHNLDIHLPLHHSPLNRRCRRIPHQLCLVAGKDDNTIPPGCITALGPAEEKLVWAERNLFGYPSVGD